MSVILESDDDDDDNDDDMSRRRPLRAFLTAWETQQTTNCSGYLRDDLSGNVGDQVDSGNLLISSCKAAKCSRSWYLESPELNHWYEIV